MGGVGVGGGPVMKDMEEEPGCRGHSSEELGSGTLKASTKRKPPVGLEVIGSQSGGLVLTPNFLYSAPAGPYRNWLPRTEPGGRPSRTEMRWQRRWPTATLASEYPAPLGRALSSCGLLLKQHLPFF